MNMTPIINGKPRRLDWRASTKPNRRPAMLASRKADDPDLLPRRLLIPAGALPPVNDQGDEGSCTANMGAELLDHLAMRAGSLLRFSRQFIYDVTRLQEGTPLDQDDGAEIPDVGAAITLRGACSEAAWPYFKGYRQAPSPDAYAEAAQHKLALYFGLPDLYEIRASLHQGFPVGFGLQVPAAIQSAAIARGEPMPYPKPGEKFEGGHAIVIIGCDLDEECAGEIGSLTVRNSWGSEWANGGNFKMPVRYALPDPTFGVLVQDACTFRSAGV